MPAIHERTWPLNVSNSGAGEDSIESSRRRKHEGRGPSDTDHHLEWIAGRPMAESSDGWHTAHTGWEAEPRGSRAPHGGWKTRPIRLVEQDLAQICAQHRGRSQARRGAAMGGGSGETARGRSGEGLHERAVST